MAGYPPVRPKLQERSLDVQAATPTGRHRPAAGSTERCDRLVHRLGRLPASARRRWAAWSVRRALATFVAITALAAGALAGQSAYSGSASPTVVTVQRGDSLWAIARRYHVSDSELAAANGMTLSQTLVIGRQLVIPGTGPPPLPSSSAPAPSSPQPAPPPPPLPSASAFCAGTFYSGPEGVLPSKLADNAWLLALRPLFVRWAEDYGLAPSYVEAIAWVESNWNEDAISKAFAVGVGQVLPTTAQEVNQELGTNLSLTSVSDNIRLEAAYLSQLRHELGDSLCLMTAAYNEGPVNLLHVGVFPETQQYVHWVLYDRARFE